MAELNTGGDSGGKGGKVRSKKQNSKVDLTAMVDLAFLLITFFMLTTSLSKPQSMDLALPSKDEEKVKTPPVKVDEHRTMTILIGEGNVIKAFMGFSATPLSGPTTYAYGKDGIRKELIKQKAAVKEYCTNTLGKPDQGIIVIIKPSTKSNYKNLVDILDEMAIVDIPSYAIVNEFDDSEKKLLADLTLSK